MYKMNTGRWRKEEPKEQSGKNFLSALLCIMDARLGGDEAGNPQVPGGIEGKYAVPNKSLPTLLRGLGKS